MSSKESEHDPVPPTKADDPAGGPRKPVEGTSFPIVGIGASAGGLEAFTELFKHLPLDTGLGVCWCSISIRNMKACSRSF
jgi:two-component system, chemotaxis family, CheB/CheR fusion protein